MNIPISRSHIYTCEVNFWRLNARTNFEKGSGVRAEGLSGT